MTELPPIIERLDAHLAEADTLGQRGHINASRDVLVNVARSDAPELRALVLQLQEERDRAVQEATAQVRVIVAQGELRQDVEQQRDALLEALKEVRMEATHRSVNEWRYTLRMIDDIAQVAIANVEGKDTKLQCDCQPYLEQGSCVHTVM